MKPLLESSVGVSQDGDYRGRYWNNCERMTTKAVACEICGRKFPKLPENEDGLLVSVFMGRTVVEECCGAVLDIVYGESGRVFAERYLEEFAENPTDFRFRTLISTLRDVLPKASAKLTEVSSEIEKFHSTLQEINAKLKTA